MGSKNKQFKELNKFILYKKLKQWQDSDTFSDKQKKNTSNYRRKTQEKERKQKLDLEEEKLWHNALKNIEK